ncbi:MAG: endolytic transglycosylase MltG [Salinivirgaceae bacterium]
MMKKIVITAIILTILGGSAVAYFAWQYIYKNNIAKDKPTEIFIHTGDNFADLMEYLESKDIIINSQSFRYLATKMNLPNHVYPGRYIIKPGTNNKELVTKLRSGAQTPLMVTFTSVRTREKLASVLSQQIELDSATIAERLHNNNYAKTFGFNAENFPCMFIPNTYEMYWNISADGLFKRMHKEYQAFWTANRKQKAEALNLSPAEVCILASIVEKESALAEEYPIIAGVYHNRLERGIPLQADPTVVFAVGDFTIKRILNKHLEIESPYNTYKFRGLPPGPITIPSTTAIDGVLNKQEHKYLYFCAKDDFSGQHVFAKTLRQHNQNARLYRKALNRERIYK